MLKKMVFWVFVFLFCISTTDPAQEKSSERKIEKILIKQVHRPSYSSDLVYRTEISPDGKHMAYVAGIGNKWSVVVDGKEEGAQYDTAFSPVFSPDSKRVAYRVNYHIPDVSNKPSVVVDGKEGKQYDGIYTTSIFSPDSKHVFIQNSVK